MIQFKQGDTVDIACRLVSREGKVDTAVDLTTYAIASKVKHRDGSLICTFTVVIDSDQTANRGVYNLQLSEVNSLACVPGNHFCDIEYRVGSVVVSTETFPCVVDANIT